MSKLFVVPTPIGNLKDITFRAVEILNQVDIILAEDTRTSSKLLNHYNIATPMQSYHMYNEHKILNKIIDLLNQGNDLALISDAGTPGISDPGFLLVRSCVENNILVECLPGPTAFIPALINSGYPTDKFIFEGFLPVKKGRQTRLKFLAEENRTIVLYESPHKLVKTLVDISKFFSENVQISVSRELSKIFEQTLRGRPREIIKHFESNKPKGEIVIIINSNTHQ
jgi:16S rRNA (cytidine1402-2'-O)-methyltransferase